MPRVKPMQGLAQVLERRQPSSSHPSRYFTNPEFKNLTCTLWIVVDFILNCSSQAWGRSCYRHLKKVEILLLVLVAMHLSIFINLRLFWFIAPLVPHSLSYCFLRYRSLHRCCYHFFIYNLYNTHPYSRHHYASPLGCLEGSSRLEPCNALEKLITAWGSSPS